MEITATWKALFQQMFDSAEVLALESLGTGLIHQTYRLKIVMDGQHQDLVLQCFNDAVFREPEAVMDNLLRANKHLKTTDYPLRLLEPFLFRNQKYWVLDAAQKYWRASIFLENTFAVERARTTQEAYQAARAFGLLLSHLRHLPPTEILDTIPDFHHLEKRYQAFIMAEERSAAERRNRANQWIVLAKKYYTQIADFDWRSLPRRVVHNDCKISNVLLDEESGRGVAVIDLDTLMAGSVVTDFGDMIRTICCTYDENARNFDQVAIDLSYFRATAEGFLQVTKSWLERSEKTALLTGAKYLILEQCIRFLADYLNQDIYYPVTYSDQNLDRAINQMHLFQSLLQREKSLQKMLDEILFLK